METKSESLDDQNAEPPATSTRPPLWRNIGVLKWSAQILVLAFCVSGLWFFGSVAANNLERQGLSPSYDFIGGLAQVPLSEGIDTSPDTAGRAIWVGMVNTFRTAIAGIILSTLLGVAIGLARLSNNWVANKAASSYVETIRNIPVLVQILFWLVILDSLPNLSIEWPLPGWLYISQKGVSMPRLSVYDGFYQWLVLMIPLAAVSWLVYRRLEAKRTREGGTTYSGPVAATMMAVFAVIAWFANPVTGFLRTIFESISDAWGSMPQALVQASLTLLAFGLAIRWIMNFFKSRRTPAGLAKITDDDYFRIASACFIAIFATVFFWRLWPGFSSWIINSGSDLFAVAADKFGGDRSNQVLEFNRPGVTQGRFNNFTKSGLTLSNAHAALLIGLVLYTASFIAEIVRGGILAIPRGQTEAAAALGLSKLQGLRKVILPQTFRIIMPPLGNQYLNLTKNTTLGVAIGYAEVVSVGRSISNKNNQVLATFSIWIVFFLACSLVISVVVNKINSRLAIVER